MPPSHSLLTSLRLKLTVLLLRLFLRFGAIPRARRRDDLATASLHVRTHRTHVPSRDPKRTILVDIYFPPEPDLEGSEAGDLPVVVNWHGSGFVLPLHGSDSLYCARMARDAGVVVVDAEYRKAPECAFPGALHDVEDVLRWVGMQEGVDKRRVVVSGFSAGGNLALGAASWMGRMLEEREGEGGVKVVGCVAWYAVTDLSIPPEVKMRGMQEEGKWLAGALPRFFNQCYVPDGRLMTDQRVSPGLARTQDFPEKVVLVACEEDMLAAEARALAEKLDSGNEDGNGNGRRRVVYREVQGARHGFDKGCVAGSVEARRRDEMYRFVVEEVKGMVNM
ncbi:alpha/beta-hydrolase [Lophiostoma macrostomum CBS 122681]|uniref:Alpha/beta-hydrolase n=1 Tax=Lophiostoma macrostomum CBS 122681 TaxID=1314788 RepID=A0A6A6TG54_9PLEO|nr:alpha/beta-hydrolase [Lophiostoma macrostomum CBS 122681]